MAKRTFWQKITGAVRADDELYEEFEDVYEDDYYEDAGSSDEMRTTNETNRQTSDGYLSEQEIDSVPVMELPLDIYHDEDNIYIDAFIPGVSLEDINIELSREMISISGDRQVSKTDTQTEYYARELQWGEFARSVSLPEEIDIDSSSAVEVAGVLKITLPKFNKSRKAKLTVKSIKK